METNILFIDQTLNYALKNRDISKADLVSIEQRISDMAQVMHDISMQALVNQQAHAVLDLGDVRVCVSPNVEEVRAVYNYGCNAISLFLDPREFQRPQYEKVLAEARKLGMKASIAITGIVDYSLSEISALQKLIKKYAVFSLIIDDRHSRLDSLSTYSTLLDLQNFISCVVEFHGHNGLGLATGNALAAIKSGIRRVAVSVGGIGGYPAFEEVSMAARHLLQMPIHVPQTIANTCKEILCHVGQNISMTKPIIGSHIFAHESGIHVDGVQKKSELYEPFAPESVGLSRKIIIGKHSGTAAIKLKLNELNISVNPAKIVQVLEKVRGLAIRQKAPVSDEQLQELVHEVAI